MPQVTQGLSPGGSEQSSADFSAASAPSAGSAPDPGALALGEMLEARRRESRSSPLTASLGTWEHLEAAEA